MSFRFHTIVPYGGDQRRCIKCRRIWDLDELPEPTELCDATEMPKPTNRKEKSRTRYKTPSIRRAK